MDWVQVYTIVFVTLYVLNFFRGALVAIEKGGFIAFILVGIIFMSMPLPMIGRIFGWW